MTSFLRSGSLLFLICCAGVSLGSEVDANDLTDAQVKSVLSNSGITSPWYVTQLYYNENGDHWIVYSYSTPRPLSGEICESQLTELYVVRPRNSLKVSSRNTVSTLALRACDGVTSSQFRRVQGHLDDAELPRLVDLAFRIAKNPHDEVDGIKTAITPEALAALPSLTRKNFWSIEAPVGDNIRVLFSVPGSGPQLLCFEFEGGPDALVGVRASIEDGPDIVRVH
jgi:hypothetical protein